MVMVPIELPGESVPLLTVTEPSCPVPPSVPPLTTADETIEPFTSSVPALTVVVPV